LLGGILNELPKDTPRQGVATMIKNAFGDLHAVHKAHVIDTLKKQFTDQRAYLKSLTTDAQWKISLYVTNEPVGGLTSSVTESAPMKTMSLKADFLNLHPLEMAKVLIHEASHAVGNTVDYFYLPVDFLPSDVEDETVKLWSAHFRAILADIGKKGPHHSIVTPKYWTALNALTGREVTQDISAIEFQDPAVRLPMLLRNADTYSSFVMGTKLPVRLIAKHNARAARFGGTDPTKEIF
jgi:hypothetical protein